MCNKRVVDHRKTDNQAVYLMDTSSSTALSAPASNPCSAPGSTNGSNDETPRVKFLCSFLGSILPRPQDGKLRYVGGETRIVSLPRDITYEELMNRMRELYEGAAVLKYQLPDEDLDALVSVVNDDDVTNMMEEYEKLGSGDGFTRLRIFLFSHPEQDGSSHYGDGDERETERRYVDALNSLNEGYDLRRCESPMVTPIADDLHLTEPPFNKMNIDGGLHNQRSAEIISSVELNKVVDGESKISSHESSNSSCLRPAEENDDVVTPGKTDPCALENSRLSVNRLSFLPELIASVKKAALEEVEEVNAKAEDGDSAKQDVGEKEVAANESESLNAHDELEAEFDNENLNISKIEPTKAEAEAISRGLQTIKNDDLEEIRELGSGTYGAVHHGKWKGSDVAIKRIKASCFAGRPSERERLIADFWKEALILSSLHHPNVVAFYGIVRDGPDGSLATVTEFMVNGSLKQFLQKKDRTIDRRKRLIIAMDAAFGMEYLHGKNIVHFDLKCENLLVNMRDPQRPVCKIGDLGLSKVRQHTLVSGGVRGTLPWMAPELLSGKSNMVSEKIDVYSFGIVMWELLTGEEPYADMHCASIIGGIVNNTLRPKIPSWCDPEWKALMEKCWASDPSERPSFSEISQKLRNMAAAINVK
ncbi:hypothetical protein SLEP1_g28645 [Rubroshorea leprosula]|uniref:Protein kinase domain-containing protein n=1 Tax=Rubroshorea leprosula TaxID=152421 RepID=A0AAV5JUA7_9ROSI|nr:hypothetical protein SLEP1_g28645 [Rubroshorea leprosula]